MVPHILSRPLERRYDVIVVGAGTSGAVVAARLSAAGGHVLLVEAGLGPPHPLDEIVDDGETVRGAMPGHALSWSRPAELLPGRDHVLAAGRTVGGSGAINGGVLHWPRPRDLAIWRRLVGARWGADAALPLLRDAVFDLDEHDAATSAVSAVPVLRAPQTSITSAALRRAAHSLGIPDEPDKNRGGAAGVGPVTRNVIDGVRQVPARRWLAHAQGASALQLRTACTVERLVIRAGRVVGVVLRDDDGPATTVLAGEVVVAAGAIATPSLLMRSGIGPAGALRRLQVDVVVDHPTLGSGLDHPSIMVPWSLPSSAAAAAAFPTAVHVEGVGDDPNATTEVLLVDRSPDSLLGLAHADEERGLLVGLPPPELESIVSLPGRGEAGEPHVRHRYLSTDADRRRARQGVRLASALLAAEPLASLVARRPAGLDDAERSDPELDAWIATHLGTAHHLVGTVRMGPSDAPGSVADDCGRVLGVDGLRIADVSLLPSVPTRGPAAAALLTGASIAEAMGA